MKGMNEAELREAATCFMCQKLILATGVPLFWRVHLVRHAVDMDAARRQDGLGAMLGNSRLANIMGPDETMTKVISEKEVSICEACSGEETSVYELGLADV